MSPTSPTPAAIAAAEDERREIRIRELECAYSVLTMPRRIRELEEIIDRAASAGWQPIETAPKDGTWILAHRHDDKLGIPRIMKWRTITGLWVDDHRNPGDPEIWMPLPSAPTPNQP